MRTSAFFARLTIFNCLFIILSSICFSQNDNAGLARTETGDRHFSGINNEPLFASTDATKKIDEPLNIQCRVFEVLKEPNQRLTCKALSMQGDTVHLKFSWRGRFSACPVKKGTWISVFADNKDEKNKWVCRKIKVNN